MRTCRPGLARWELEGCRPREESEQCRTASSGVTADDIRQGLPGLGLDVALADDPPLPVYRRLPGDERQPSPGRYHNLEYAPTGG